MVWVGVTGGKETIKKAEREMDFAGKQNAIGSQRVTLSLSKTGKTRLKSISKRSL